MSIIHSHIQTNSPDFQANFAYHQALAADLRARLAEIRQGGGAEQRRRHEERGKLFVRDRIDTLIDPDSAFLEIG
ncbi:MAG: methylcrotonoyl-CoA carboxylase, partial [Chloroflexus sp.]|nr:methylcrotonoyl-CoA carboxylase [Chloroflexus sp.]